MVENTQEKSNLLLSLFCLLMALLTMSCKQLATFGEKSLTAEVHFSNEGTVPFEVDIYLDEDTREARCNAGFYDHEYERLEPGEEITIEMTGSCTHTGSGIEGVITWENGKSMPFQGGIQKGDYKIFYFICKDDGCSRDSELIESIY